MTHFDKRKRKKLFKTEIRVIVHTVQPLRMKQIHTKLRWALEELHKNWPSSQDLKKLTFRRPPPNAKVGLRNVVR